MPAQTRLTCPGAPGFELRQAPVESILHSHLMQIIIIVERLFAIGNQTEQESFCSGRVQALFLGLAVDVDVASVTELLLLLLLLHLQRDSSSERERERERQNRCHSASVGECFQEGVYLLIVEQSGKKSPACARLTAGSSGRRKGGQTKSNPGHRCLCFACQSIVWLGRRAE